MTDGYNIGQTTPAANRDDLQSLLDIEDWMIDRISKFEERQKEESIGFNDSSIDTRRYIADTVRYGGAGKYGDQAGIYQTGCSPNYYGGIWSLACCKHYMRSRRNKFRNDIFGWDATESETLTPRKPLFVFTYARKNQGHQFLASIAMVTRGFRTMEAYRDYLENPDVSDLAKTARLTSVQNPTEVAEKYGDCHAGFYRPSAVHPHMQDSPPCSCSRSEAKGAYHADMNGDHVICLSEPEYWTAWTTPAFETQSTKEQNANGRPLRRKSDESLDHYFLRLLDENTWITEFDAQ